MKVATMKKSIAILGASVLTIACGQPSVESLPPAPAGMDKVQYDGINFGIDFSTFANDGYCDDPRFEGEDVSPLTVIDDIYQDATDCLNAYKRGTARLRPGASAK